MKPHTAFASILCTVILVPLTVTAQSHSPGDILFKRTDGLNVGGDDFTGALPENTDTALPIGVLDDSGTSIITQINVDTEGVAPSHGIDLSGDNFDLAFTFQLYDNDGQFSFTENFDDRVQITITPIVSATDLTATGGSMVHSDVAWNVRTFGDYSFASGGWFDAQVLMTEDGGGAQSAAGIGFGFSNAASSANEFDYALIGGGAVFDIDGNRQSYGSMIISFDPNLDNDGDGIPDGLELSYLEITDLTQLSTGDFDGDGVNDPQEISEGTDPTNTDTDGDGSSDGDEKPNGTDPLDDDSDDDGLLDGVETNTGTFNSPTDTGTDPLDIDSDGDNASDSYEITQRTDPNDNLSIPGPLLIQPSFAPINNPSLGTYGPGVAGLDYQQNHYNSDVIINGGSQGNYNVHTSGIPAPNQSTTIIEPYLDHGPGGTTISGHNRPFLAGTLDNFSVRVNGFVDFTGFTTGTYAIHLGADDTNYFVMDTFDGQVTDQHECCPQDQIKFFTLTQMGIFPFDNVFGEQTGGEWADLGISGPGIVGTVALGDTAAGSPPVSTISFPAEDTDGDGLPDAYELSFAAIDNLTQLGGGDFDGDDVSDLDEFTQDTDPTDVDTDGDGLDDGVETNTGTFNSPTDTGTDPLNSDSDDDGLSDGVETNTDTFNGPSDTGTDPNKPDTDGDGASDSIEIILGRDPTDPGDVSSPPTTSYCQDFDGYPDGSTDLGDFSTVRSTNGPASVQGNQLRLSQDGLGNTRSSFRIPKLTGSSDGWTAVFDYTLTSDTAGQNPADGFSFSFGAIPPFDASMGNDFSEFQHGESEEGWPNVNSLSFVIDTWDNGGEHGVNISSAVGGVKTDHALNSGAPLNQQQTVTGTATISWNPTDGASFTTTGLSNATDANFVNIPIPGFNATDEMIWAFGARTGGAHETILIDNLCITTESEDTYRFTVSSADDGATLDFSWNSSGSEVYSIASTDDPAGNPDPNSWSLVPGFENIAATPPLNLTSIPKPAEALRLFKLIAAPVPPLFFDDFESGQGGWTTGVDDAFGNTRWELGTPNGTSGPLTGADGSLNAFSTNLGDYGGDSDIFLRSPDIDLPGATAACLVFEHYRDADGFADVGTVRILKASDLSELQVIDPDVFLLDLDFVSFSADLDAAVLGETITIEFRFQSNPGLDGFSGWSIDNVEVILK
ncbi:MAG: hypothetical protein OSB65_15965 [Roseibacillus sp.]|nr:hypothetical protein [Roseibacillus sp.]